MSVPALVQLHSLLRSHEFCKYYQALVFGRWQHGSIEVSMPLSKIPIATQHDRVVTNAQGKPATTHFRLVQMFNQCTLMEIQTETGRTHQIRAHAAYLGHALAGDRKYGDFAFNCQMRTIGLKRLFLHANRVVFELFDTKAYDVSAPLDDQLSNVLERLTSTDAETDRI